MGSSVGRDLREQAELRERVRSDRVLRWAAAGGAGWLLLFAVLVWVGKSRPAFGMFVGDIVYAVPDVVAVVLSALAVRYARGWARRMWVLLAVANLLRLTGDVVWAGYAYLNPDGVPYPSVADAAYLSQYVLVIPVLLIGFRGTSRLRRARGLLDTGLVVVGVVAVGWQLFIAPQLSETFTLASATGAGYLLGDLAVLSCLIAIGLSGHRMVPYAVLLAAGAFAANTAADIGYTYLTLFASYADDSWLNIGWQAAAVGQCLAALVAVRHQEHEARIQQLDRDLTFPPVLIAVLATCGLIATDELRDGQVGRAALVTAAVMVGGLLLRQWMTTSDRTRLAVQLQASLREQERLAVTDSLTGLYNRRFFQETLRLEAERAARQRSGLALIVLDLDYFKRVNDTHGHQVGDVVLTQAADRIRQLARGSDIVARYGGEEFVCIVPDVDGDTALAMAERFRYAIGQDPIPTGDGRHVPMTVSIGVAVAGGGPIDTERLINDADTALYRAKTAGRDQVVLAHQRPDQASVVAAAS